MTRRPTLLALAFALVSPSLTGCACYRPLFPRLRCLLDCHPGGGVPSPVPVGAPVVGGHPVEAGFPVGAAIGAPGCANCGPSGVGMGSPIPTVPMQFDPHQGAAPAGFPAPGGFGGNYPVESLAAGSGPIPMNPVGAMPAGYSPYPQPTPPDPHGGYPAPAPTLGSPTMPQSGLPPRTTNMGPPVVVQGSGYPQYLPQYAPQAMPNTAPGAIPLTSVPTIQYPAPFTGPSTPLPAPMPVSPVPLNPMPMPPQQ